MEKFQAPVFRWDSEAQRRAEPLFLQVAAAPPPSAPGPVCGLPLDKVISSRHFA